LLVNLNPDFEAWVNLVEMDRMRQFHCFALVEKMAILTSSQQAWLYPSCTELQSRVLAEQLVTVHCFRVKMTQFFQSLVISEKDKSFAS
jgi:hypothetical protein